MNVMLFLGSGVSKRTWSECPKANARIPDVEGITQEVLTGNWKKTNNAFEPRVANERPCPDAQRCQEFLRRLCCRVEEYYEDKRGSGPNYEDLFYLTDLLCSMELNPAIQHFVQQMRNACCHLSWQPGLGLNRITFYELCTNVCDFIQCVVWNQLNQTVTPRGMNLIPYLAKRASAGSDIHRLTICTLNHDRLVEQQLKGMGYEDGFGVLKNGGRRFDPNRLRKSAKRIHFLKLHGSIIWFRWQRCEGEHNSDRYVIGQSYKPPKENGVEWRKPEFPTILAGSYNKHAQYNRGIFKEFMHAFHSELSKHKLIVMSGYGWGDFGINERLCDWLGRDHSHRIVLLSKDDPTFMLSQNHVIWLQWQSLIRRGQLVVIRKWLENTTWAEIRKCIASEDKLQARKPRSTLNPL